MLDMHGQGVATYAHCTDKLSLEMMSFSFLTIYLADVRLDTLVLLKANEANAWGMSIYSYVKASRHTLLLIDLCWACVLSVEFTMWSGGYCL